MTERKDRLTRMTELYGRKGEVRDIIYNKRKIAVSFKKLDAPEGGMGFLDFGAVTFPFYVWSKNPGKYDLDELEAQYKKDPDVFHTTHQIPEDANKAVIKRIRGSAISEDNRPAAIARFAREGRILEIINGAVAEQCVPWLYFTPREDDLREDMGLPIVMEFVRGVSLDRLVNKECAISQKTVIACETTKAFADIYEATGIIHRDIKPENILVYSEPTHRGNETKVRIIDFGIGVDSESENVAITQENTILGTPIYYSAYSFWCFWVDLVHWR